MTYNKNMETMKKTKNMKKKWNAQTQKKTKNN